MVIMRNKVSWVTISMKLNIRARNWKLAKAGAQFPTHRNLVGSQSLMARILDVQTRPTTKVQSYSHLSRLRWIPTKYSNSMISKISFLEIISMIRWYSVIWSSPTKTRSIQYLKTKKSTEFFRTAHLECEKLIPKNWASRIQFHSS